MASGNIPGRWIDKTWSAMVNVEEASQSQRDEFQRLVPPELLQRILKSEGVTSGREAPKIISVEYDGSNPDRYEEGTYIGIVVKREKDRVKVLFVYENGEQEIAWLTR